VRALIRDRYGLPDVFKVREVDRPVPGEGEVLVRVRACSINDWDWGLLQGPSLPSAARNRSRSLAATSLAPSSKQGRASRG
jgi:NADPH:quinone reductase-like Zn-dependent oxidoreductase